MGATAIFQLPYPEPADPADVPLDMRELADTIDGLLRPPVSSSLPASPSDGQEVYYMPTSDVSIRWHMRYNASSPNPDKWEFLGGTKIYSGAPAGSLSTTSTSFVALTSGPTLTVPRTGQFFVGWGLTALSAAAGAVLMQCIPGRGLTAIPGLANLQVSAQASNDGARIFSEQITFLNASDVVQLLVRNSAAVNATFSSGYIYLQPVRIS